MNHQIAHEAIAHIIANDDMRERFLAESGMGLDSLRTQLQDPDCLGSVLDFLLENEPILMAFCSQTHISPEQIWRARKAYPGLKVWDSI